MCPSCHVYDRLTVCSCLTTLAMHKLDSNGPAQPTQCPSCEECVVLENTIHSKNYNLENNKISGCTKYAGGFFSHRFIWSSLLSSQRLKKDWTWPLVIYYYTFLYVLTTTVIFHFRISGTAISRQMRKREDTTKDLWTILVETTWQELSSCS